MANRPKIFLILIRSAARTGGMADEMLEAAQAAAAFGQEVQIAFLDDGVFRLAAPASARVREFDQTDIDAVWVERESLAERGISAGALPEPATCLSRAELIRLISGADLVLSG